jgi:autotransporter translocation and assembly factor TamB
LTLGPTIRAVMLSIAVLLGTTWLLAFGLLNGWYPQLQRWLIIETLDRTMGVDAEIHSADGSLVEGLKLKGIVIKAGSKATRTAMGLTGDTPFVAEFVEVAVDLSQAFEERLVIVKSLTVDGIALRLQQDEDRGWRLLGLSRTQPPYQSEPIEPDEDNASWRVKFQEVVIRNAELTARWFDLQGPGYLTANGSLTTRDLSWPNESDHLLPSVLGGDFRVTEGALGPLKLSAGRLRVNGTQDRVQLRLERTTAADADLGRFHLSAEATVDIAKTTPSVSAFTAQLAFTRLNVKAIAAQASSTLQLPATDLSGQLRLELTDPKAEIIELDLTFDPSKIDERAFDSATGRLRYSILTEQWTFTELVVSSERSRLEGSGSGTRDAIDSLVIDASNVPIAGLADALDVDLPIAGRIDLSTRLSGIAGDPKGDVLIEGEVEFDGRVPLDVAIAVTAHGQRTYEIVRFNVATHDPSNIQLESSGAAFLKQTNQGWTLTDLQFVGGAGDIQIAKAVTSHGKQDVELNVDALDLTRFAAYIDPEIEVGGLLTGPIAFTLESNRLQLDADAKWQAARFANITANTIEVRATTEENTIHLDGNVDWGSTSDLEVMAKLPNNKLTSGLQGLASDPALEVTLSVEKLPASDLAIFLPLDQRTDQSLEGSITGLFHVNGSRAGPEADCSATWTGARFGTAVADNVHLTCQTKERELRIDLGISNANKNGFVADVSLDIDGLLEDPRSLFLNPSNRANLTAQDVDLAWLIPSASARRLGRIKRVSGRATGELTFNGSEAGPQLNGELNVDNAKLSLALLKEKIGPIVGRLVFSNDEVRAERIEIGSSKGPAVVTGRYRFGTHGQDELAVRAQFKKFALTHFPLLDARVSGDLRLSGSLNAIDAEGDLAFSRVEISLPTPDDPLLREVRILGLEGDDAEAKKRLGNATPSAYQTMHATIDIDVRPGAKIKERGADIVAEGQFRLRKKRLSPTLLQGNLQTTGGTYTFLGRTFDVTSGSATFDEQIPPDPEIQVSASRNIGDVTVGIELTGQWSDRHSRLTSVPAMDENQILSYLVFDKPMSEIGDRDDQRLNAVAAQLASNLALSEITKAISDQLPIDEISIDVGEGLNVSSIGVETSVGDDIMVRYDRALQTGVGDRVTVEWKFYKNLSLRSEYVDGDNSGFDLFWSYQY